MHAYSSSKFSVSGANNTVHLSENSKLESYGFLSQADRYLHADPECDIRFAQVIYNLKFKLHALINELRLPSCQRNNYQLLYELFCFVFYIYISNKYFISYYIALCKITKKNLCHLLSFSSHFRHILSLKL